MALLFLARLFADAPLPLIGGSVACGAFGLRRLSASARWAAGARGERDVARQLRRLSCRGWLVLHDVPREGGGNVDHLLAGQRGLYTIETKLRTLDERALAQARAHAYWATRRFSRPAVAILCLARRADGPHLREGVWCMGAEHLRRFIGTAQGRKLRGNG